MVNFILTWKWGIGVANLRFREMNRLTCLNEILSYSFGFIYFKTRQKVCKVNALLCYQCFSLRFLLATANWSPAEDQQHQLLIAPKRCKKAFQTRIYQDSACIITGWNNKTSRECNFRQKSYNNRESIHHHYISKWCPVWVKSAPTAAQKICYIYLFKLWLHPQKYPNWLLFHREVFHA